MHGCEKEPSRNPENEKKKKIVPEVKTR